MRIGKVLFGSLVCMSVFYIGTASAAGVWDDNVTLLGVNPNGDYQNGDEVRIKKATAGNSGCSVVKFRAGSGNIPSNTSGVEARNRIYATALAAYLADKRVSIWVWDTTNCYGLMLVFTDSSGF